MSLIIMSMNQTSSGKQVGELFLPYKLNEFITALGMVVTVEEPKVDFGK